MRFTLLSSALAAAALVSAQDPADSVIHPGVAWFDTDNNRVYAGGANLYEEGGVYYMIGEGKKVLSDCSACFNLYSSSDLVTWKFEGCALNNSDIVAPPPYNKESYYRMERPKIFKCPGDTGPTPYRLVFHCDTSGFAMQSIGVLTAPSITGPYTFAAPCFQPDGQPSYDQGTYFDDPARGGDGHMYHIRSVRNQFAGISQMDTMCLNTTGIVSQGPDMEGQAIMRDSNGTLHAAGSHLTGWSANAAIFVTSPNPSLVGATWGDEENPSGDPTTFNSQSTFIFPYKHADGHYTFMWMADRWNENGPGGLDNATLIWLPLVPPSNASAPTNVTVGWFVVVDLCDAANPHQIFTIDTATSAVIHTSSGLCLSGLSYSSPTGNIELAECGNPSAGSNQVWYPAKQRSVLASVKAGEGNGCIELNNANQYVDAGNPVIAYDCGSGTPAWNAQFILPPDDTPGVVQARAQDGSDSGYCMMVTSGAVPNQWTLPWHDGWSLKDF